MHLKAFLLFLLSFNLAYGQDTLRLKEMDYPLYEDYPVLRDYRVNQSLLDAAKFGILGAPLLGLAGFLIEGKSEFPILTYLGVVAGGSLGVLSGGVYGYFKGEKYNDRKRSDVGFHARTRRVGLEFGGGSGIEKDGSSIAMTFREKSKTPYFPDEYALEFSAASWRNESNTSFHAERKFGLSIAYRSMHKILAPVYGAGIGYTKGYEDPSLNIDGKDIILRRKNGLLLHTFLGGKLNLFDLCHVGMLVDFEPLGLYNYYEGYENYPLGSFTLKATLGAYLF